MVGLPGGGNGWDGGVGMEVGKKRRTGPGGWGIGGVGGVLKYLFFCVFLSLVFVNLCV